MTRSFLRTVAIVGLCVTVGGCVGNLRRGPAPIAAAPSAPVQTAQLPPPTTQPEPLAPVAEASLPGEGAVAPRAEVPTATATVGRTDLLGGWAISSGGETCQLFMSLTQWTGGYRASTRGCNSPTLAGISAWELNDNKVTLKSGDGASTVATLAATGPTNFNGATSDGAGITVSR